MEVLTFDVAPALIRVKKNYEKQLYKLILPHNCGVPLAPQYKKSTSEDEQETKKARPVCARRAF
jgi:hypothetical protein